MTRRLHTPSRSRRAAVALLAVTSVCPPIAAHALSPREIAELKQLVPTDRMIQACFLKLEDRIAAQTRYRHVDRVVMDAFSRAHIEGRTLRAGGAAFRNDGNWFKLRFRCAVARDRLHVEAVDYAIVSPEPVPRAAWEEHWLFP